jgi:hypothetical protein
MLAGRKATDERNFEDCILVPCTQRAIKVQHLPAWRIRNVFKISSVHMEAESEHLKPLLAGATPLSDDNQQSLAVVNERYRRNSARCNTTLEPSDSRWLLRA